MKNLKLIFPLFLFATATLIFACGGGENKAEDQQGKEYTSAYICPMHCTGSGSDKAGTCPVCKMDYVVNENLKKGGQSDGTETNDSHDGHDHGDHDGHDHDNHDGHSH